MGYIQDFEHELDLKLQGLSDDPEERSVIVAFAKKKVLDSYRNGVAAGKKPRKERNEA